MLTKINDSTMNRISLEIIKCYYFKEILDFTVLSIDSFYSSRVLVNEQRDV